MTTLQISTIIAVALIASPAVSASVSEPSAGDQKEVYNATDKYNGLSGAEIMGLWNRDPDPGFGNQTVDIGGGGESKQSRTRQAQYLLRGTDTLSMTPPEEPIIWNRNEWENYTQDFETNKKTSHHLKGANTENGLYVRDASVNYYSVSPATKIYPNRSTGPITHIDQEATARALVDYRVSLPPDDTRFTDDERTVSRTLVSHEVDVVCIIKGSSTPSEPGTSPCEDRLDGKVLNQTQGSHTPTLKFDVGSEVDPTNVSVVAKIDVTVEKKVRERIEAENGAVYRDVNPDPDETELEKVSEQDVPIRTVYSTEESSVVVADTTSVVSSRAQISKRKVSQAGTEEAVYDVAIQRDYWSAIETADAKIHSRWRFVPAKDTRWDTVVQTTENGSQEASGPTPVNTYAAPIAHNLIVESPESNQSTASGDYATQPRVEAEQAGDPVQQPNLTAQLDENITLSHPDRKYYNRTTRIVFEWNRGRLSDISHTGLVFGETATFGAQIEYDKVERRESNLTLSVVDRNRTAVAYKIELRDEKTGKPIETAGNPGYVSLRGERKDTNETGVAVYVVNRTNGVALAEYAPVDWWTGRNNGVGYYPDSSSYHVDGGVAGPETIERVYVDGVFLVSMIGLCLYLLSKSPIWRLIE